MSVVDAEAIRMVVTSSLVQLSNGTTLATLNSTGSKPLQNGSYSTTLTSSSLVLTNGSSSVTINGSGVTIVGGILTSPVSNDYRQRYDQHRLDQLRQSFHIWIAILAIKQHVYHYPKRWPSVYNRCEQHPDRRAANYHNTRRDNPRNAFRRDFCSATPRTLKLGFEIDPRLRAAW